MPVEHYYLSSFCYTILTKHHVTKEQRNNLNAATDSLTSQTELPLIALSVAN